MKRLGIGLTGGIGCGKSTAANMFRELGVDVIDTDAISHELTAAGGEAIPQISALFGADSLDADGALDRAKMRQLVFSDRAAKKKLESILHPMIRREVEKRIENGRLAYYLVVVPLLLETGNYFDLISRVLVIDCSETTQIARAMERSRLSRDEVTKIMANQVSRQTRLEKADDLLQNDGEPEQLRQKVAQLHRKYLEFVVKSSVLVQNA